MYCKDCGEKINGDAKFCCRCGTEIEIHQLNNNKMFSDNKFNNHQNFWLSNQLVFILSLISSITVVLEFTISLLEAIFSAPYGNGLVLMFIPIFIVIIFLPQIITIITSGINMAKNSYKLLVSIFVFSILSIPVLLLPLITNYFDALLSFLSPLHLVALISNLALIIIVFVKLILKNK